MLSFIRRNRISRAALLNSKLFNDKSFYARFSRDLSNAKQEVIIESPYMTIRRVNELAPLFQEIVFRGSLVRINTRNPEHHDDYLRNQSYLAIELLRHIGVKVVTYRDYRHRKVAIIDSSILWENSLNILSQNNSRELMRRTVSESLCKQMLSYTGINSWHW